MSYEIEIKPVDMFTDAEIEIALEQLKAESKRRKSKEMEKRMEIFKKAFKDLAKLGFSLDTEGLDMIDNMMDIRIAWDEEECVVYLEQG